MKKFGAVFKFEFKKLVTGKAFISMTLIFAIVAAGTLSFPRIKDMVVGDKEVEVTDEMEVVGIANQSLFNDEILLQSFSESFGKYEVELLDINLQDAKKMVDDDDYSSIVFIEDEASYTLITKSIGINDNFRYIVDGILLNEYKVFLLTEQGMDLESAYGVLNTQIEGNLIEMGKNQFSSFFYTYLLLFSLYMSIIIYGQLVATSVASEKSSRAMETLVTTVSPVKMMFGKVIGAGCAALSQLFIILGSGVLFYNLNKEYWGVNDIVKSIFDIPTEIMIISAVLFILGFFLYAFMYAAIGSLASRVEDISSSTMAITFVSIIAFMVVMFSMNTGKVDSAVMQFCSYFPLTSPYALLVRSAMGDMAMFEIILSIGILIATSIGIGYLSAGIYRLGVLLYGKPPKISEVVKLLKK